MLFSCMWHFPLPCQVRKNWHKMLLKRFEILINYRQDKDIEKESHLNYSKFDYIAFFIA